MRGYRTTVTTTPTKILASVGGKARGSGAIIKNSSSNTAVFLGGSGVTTSDGFQLSGGESVALEFERGESLFAVASSGSVVLHILEGGE